MRRRTRKMEVHGIGFGGVKGERWIKIRRTRKIEVHGKGFGGGVRGVEIRRKRGDRIE